MNHIIGQKVQKVPKASLAAHGLSDLGVMVMQLPFLHAEFGLMGHEGVNWDCGLHEHLVFHASVVSRDRDNLDILAVILWFRKTSPSFKSGSIQVKENRAMLLHVV